MRYDGSEAVRLDGAEVRQPQRRPAPQPSFQVLPGGGLDARARRGVDPQFVAHLRLCVLAVVLLVAIGGVRVALSAATVSSLETTSSLRSEISDAKDLNSELQIERSVDASAQRIIRIATENYGMILATNVDSISIGSAQQASTNDQSDSAESGQAASDATDGQQDASTNASSDAGSSDAADADSGESSESSSPSAEVTTASEASSDSSVDDATGDTSATLTSQDEAVLSNLSPSNAGANAVSEAELENAA